MYLENEIDELHKMYPNSFNSKSKTSLRTLAKNENKNLSYKMLFPDGKFHEINFLKKNGTLYSLLKGLVIRKTTINIGNADQNDLS